MQHVSRKVEEERSLDFKEKMKEDLKKEDFFLKERETCQRFNVIIVTTLVIIEVIVLKDQMIGRGRETIMLP